MFKNFFVIILIAMFIFTGCSTTSTLNLNRSISPADIQKMVSAHHARIQSMQGEGRISIETPEISQSGSFVLTLLKPDSVLINFQGPFGIKIGSALVTRTGFLFYNSWENKLITGSSSMENLDRILHVQLNFDELLNLFAGGTFLAYDLHSPDKITFEDDEYVYTYTSYNSTRKYFIDPKSLSIQKIQFLDPDGKLFLEQAFSNFENIDGTPMPYNIRIIQPKAQQMLSLSYSDILVNTEKLQFSITIPNNVERIRW